jgi:hypothetical protein
MVERTNEEEQAAKRQGNEKKTGTRNKVRDAKVVATLETSKQENEQQRSLSLLDLKDPDSLTATCSAT